MVKKKDTSRQRLLASARKALAIRHAVAPVPRFEARTAGLDGARKRARKSDNAPTDEQEAKATFVEADVNDYVNGVRTKIGRAFKRQARFETIEGLTIAQLMALRRYRRAFDESELSTVKSGLDVGTGGRSSGADSALSRLEKVAFADVEVLRIEATVSRDVLFTLRMVALQDLDFKAVAVERFGTASTRRRQRVRFDFLRAADQLVRRAAPHALPVRTDDMTTEGEATAAVPPAFMDDRGFMRSDAEIAALLRALAWDEPTQDEGLAAGHETCD